MFVYSLTLNIFTIVNQNNNKKTYMCIVLFNEQMIMVAWYCEVTLKYVL